MSTQNLLKQRKVAMLALILATSLTFAACTSTTSTTVTPSTLDAEEIPANAGGPDGQGSARKRLGPGSGEAPARTTDMNDTEQVRTINVEAGSFYYTPNEIRVKKGEKIKLVLNSVDMMHDFVIDELDVKIPVTKSGSSATVEFTAETAGSFEYYCSVGQHRASGQVGTIIVE